MRQKRGCDDADRTSKRSAYACEQPARQANEKAEGDEHDVADRVVGVGRWITALPVLGCDAPKRVPPA